MQDDRLEFYLGRWETTAPEDRPKVIRQLIVEIRTEYAGDDDVKALVGRFVSLAIDRKAFPDINDKEERTLFAAAKLAMKDDIPEPDDEDEQGSLGLNEKRKKAKAEREALLKEFNKR